MCTAIGPIAATFLFTTARMLVVVKICTTRLPSNLRPTTRECVHLVMRGHFRSGDEDGGHIVRSAIVENPVLLANCTTLCVIEPELLPSEVVRCCQNRDFRPFFRSVTLTLTQ